VWTIYKKEIRSFLSSLIAYIVMAVFLCAIGLFMWVIKGTTVFDLGVAGMDVLFQFAPLVFIFLVSAVTMKSFAEEKRLGTLETLTTHPVSDWGIILGKFFAALSLVAFALLPTLIYYYTVYQLGDPPGNLDTGATWGSYAGLLLLGAAYVSIGLFQQCYDRQSDCSPDTQHEPVYGHVQPVWFGRRSQLDERPGPEFGMVRS
jgi:ABC-2 type transport system permease protein